MKNLGSYLLFLFSLVRRPESPRILFNRTMEEAVLIGINSVFIVAVVSTFIGAVTCVQISYNLNNAFIPRSTIGFMVREMTILEMAPTITSIVLAGKVGSNIAGGLGTMRITEQVDALEVMGINSASYLVLPKMLASILVFPMLVIIAMFLSILGGYVAGTLTGALSGQEYITGLRSSFIGFNITFALIKSVVFAFIISSISSYKGYFTTGGALEVGESSTNAVTNSVIALLIADYVCAQVLL
ncbi:MULTISPECIES: MlaE family ABC transporter permease [Rufibacter]|uniref:Phospholipid/cholesterol/gamma-HCH transport system permease protein n=1 Tax=Rufibacter quisquiliarum TaxID=1549639 RepID=A0A839GSN7_9BACT|nr:MULTISPECIES: ABC transporter permease [Rufibacter]MBA9077816.1 phospholipid/cholesterol/gamma-HCH transport system permease protein [Rufibacter quisquiliarum]